MLLLLYDDSTLMMFEDEGAAVRFFCVAIDVGCRTSKERRELMNVKKEKKERSM